MPELLDCPGIATWQRLLSTALHENDLKRYEHHIESCVACREQLESMVAFSDDHFRLAREIGDPTLAPADHALEQVVERLLDGVSRDRLSSLDAASLPFLRPTDRFGLLGMLGNYEILEVIGQGGMGIVLKAYEPALHRQVAIKVMSPGLAGSASARRRFTREAKAAAAVKHSNVVIVHGVREESGLPYLVMEYVAGESLQTRLDRTGPLEVQEICRIGLQTALGLAAAHEQGLIHRDIKPANLLLQEAEEPHANVRLCVRSSSFTVKITDFGLARMVDDVALTQNGVVAGTPEYMSPEQARGEVVDHRSDLFSLGSVLYAMCTGVPPFRVSSAVAVLGQVSDQEPEPLRALNPKVPAWLESVVNRLMKKAPADRFQTAAEVAKMLEGYLARLRESPPGSSLEIPFVGYSSVGAKKAGVTMWLRRLLWPVLTVVLLAAIALASWLPTQNNPGSAEESRKEFYHDFRGGQPLPPALKLTGPDADEVSKYEAKGLRITLPADRPVNLPVEVMADFVLSGDFEITGTYQLLSASRPKDGYGVGVSLDIADDDARNKFAKVARVMLANEESVFLCEYWKGHSPHEDYGRKAIPTKSRTGQLRLKRTGPSLRFLVADGTDGSFLEIYSRPLFGKEDMAFIHFLVEDSGIPGNAVDARLVDLRIRSSTPPPELSSESSASVAGEGVSVANGWLTAVGLIGLLLASSLSVVAWLSHRRRRVAGTRTTNAPAEVPGIDKSQPFTKFSCSGCGTKLRAKPDLFGKTVKCPKCGNAVLVPDQGPDDSMPTSVVSWTIGLVASLAIILFALCIWLWWPSKTGQSSVQPLPQVAASFLDVPLGNRFVEGVEDSGFYGDEQSDEGPFRWTNGHAKLVIPLNKDEHPRALFVQLMRPMNSSLQIKVNDRELLNEMATDGIGLAKWKKTLDLSSVEVADRLVVEILSTPMAPKDIDPRHGEDPRLIGVSVRGLKLLNSGGSDKASSAMSIVLNDTPDEPTMPGVVESGFHGEERDNAGVFRWTDGKGKLIIPIDKKQPPRALLIQLELPHTRFLRISVNDRVLIDEKAKELEWRSLRRTLDLTGIELGEKLVVEILSNTSVPKNDPREMGVQVRAVKLIHAEAGEKASVGDAPAEVRK